MDELGGLKEEVEYELNTHGAAILIGDSGAREERIQPVEAESPPAATDSTIDLGIREVGIATSLETETEESGEDQLDNHPFWQLLILAGYTRW